MAESTKVKTFENNKLNKSTRLKTFENNMLKAKDSENKHSLTEEINYEMPGKHKLARTEGQ